jgi:predicted transcriptional regulator YdeE
MKNFIKSNDIETLEVPFVMFQNNENENKIVYAMCVPVKEKVFTTPDSQIQGKNYSSFLAIKTTLKGDYSHMKKAWSKTRNYITTKKFKEDKKGFYIGIYKKSVPEVNEPSKWVTEIYIPIIKKEAAPKKVIVKDSTETVIAEKLE